MVYYAIFPTLTRFKKFRVSILHITSTLDTANTLHQRIILREAFPSHYFPSLKTGLGTVWVRQFRSGSCNYLTAATKCNIQSNQATVNPIGGKACSTTKGGLLRYISNTYSLHKVSSITSTLDAANTLHNRIIPRQAIPSHCYKTKRLHP